MSAKRAFDVLVSATGLLILCPLFAVIALCIKAESGGPVFFRQERVGRYGQLFRIHKFRTMRAGGPNAPLITIGADPRITMTGRFLRQYKLDELPQLIDVFLGKMSLVGPRPEVPRYMDCYRAEVRAKVLSVRPGITDWASIRFRDESELLARAGDPERAYVQEILPIKQRFYVDYVERMSFFEDLRILVATAAMLIRRRRGAQKAAGETS